MIALPILFFITALIYAIVGFGGGSTYTAFLVLSEVEYTALPLIALSCNIIVVAGGVFYFNKSGYLCLKQTLPWMAVSIPAAWIGGYITVPEDVFIGVLGAALFMSGIQMLRPDRTKNDENRASSRLASKWYVPPLVGGSLGFIAGITGIGGGIFLAPVLHLLKWGHAKTIAGTCSLFILVNSIAGLIGQGMKLSQDGNFTPLFNTYWILLVVVFIGGQIGSWAGTKKINSVYVKKLTACLVLYVAARLLYRVFMGI